MAKKIDVIVILLLLFFSFTFIYPAKNEPIQIEDSDVSAELIVTTPTINGVYSGMLPLNFTIKWIANNRVDGISPTITLSVDNNPGKLLIYPKNVITTFRESQLVATTNVQYHLFIPLNDGVHRITIYVQGYLMKPQEITVFNLTFTPIYFNVNNAIIQPSTSPSPSPTLTPTPIVPEIPPVMIAFIVFLNAGFTIILFKKLRTRKVNF